jgi:hypothetical protein
VKLRRLREEEPLDLGVTVVRGGDLDPVVLRADAVRYRKIYGAYGIRVFALRGVVLAELAQQTPLVRFERLTLIRVSRLAALGFRLESTGRNRYHYTVGFDDLVADVGSLVDCEDEVVANPYHDREDRCSRGGVMDPQIDLVADLNAEDDDGFGWSTLGDAVDPSPVRPGAMLVAGNPFGRAVVRVVAVDEDGQVHFSVLPAPWTRTAISSTTLSPDHLQVAATPAQRRVGGLHYDRRARDQRGCVLKNDKLGPQTSMPLSVPAGVDAKRKRRRMGPSDLSAFRRSIRLAGLGSPKQLRACADE